MRTSRAIALGTLTVGALDLADAFIFFGRRGAPPIRICQSIAAGLLGRAAFSGGLATAALGLALHFLIALAIVVVAVLAARRLPWLVRAPFITGPFYGIAVFAVMNYVVLPMSGAGGVRPAGAVLVNGLLIHMLGVGVPSALFARAAARAPSPPPLPQGRL